jgi:hypothetical protein
MTKMKLGRTAWLALGIGAFVIVLATLVMVYSRQSGEQGGLAKSLAGAGAQLSKLVSGREAQERQLSEQQGELDEAQSLLYWSKASFPVFPTGIEYDEVLAEIAHANNLEVLSMTASEPRQKKVEDITFIVISFDVEVGGDVTSILGMVNAIAADKRLASTTVEAVEIRVPEATTVGEEPKKPSATIKLSGYCYGGE